MATQTIKLESPTVVVAAPSAPPPAFQPTAPVQIAPAPQFTVQRTKPAAFYTPSNWNIEATPAGVQCVNNSTGDRFEGSQKDFSEYLRNT